MKRSIPPSPVAQRDIPQVRDLKFLLDPPLAFVGGTVIGLSCCQTLRQLIYQNIAVVLPSTCPGLQPSRDLCHVALNCMCFTFRYRTRTLSLYERALVSGIKQQSVSKPEMYLTETSHECSSCNASAYMTEFLPKTIPVFPPLFLFIYGNKQTNKSSSEM